MYINKFQIRKTKKTIPIAFNVLFSIGFVVKFFCTHWT
jgi:hypothetical protein